MRPEYQFYATLLDAFSWYRRSDADGARQEFIDKLNRVETPRSDAQLRGMAFEDAVATAPDAGYSGLTVRIHDTKCPVGILNQFAQESRGAVRQVYVEAFLPTQRGLVKVYGFIDELLADTAYDIKTTKNYNFPKYLHNWQHAVYLEALRDQGINRFVYKVTDFEDIFKEEYHYRQEDTDRLISECVHLIEFLEANRSQITDRKVFNLPPLEKTA